MGKTRLWTLAVVLITLNLTNSLTAETSIAGEEVGSVTYYKRVFKVDPEAMLKVIGLDRKALSPPASSFPGPYGNETPVGSGVLAPDPQEGPPAFSSPSKVHKAISEFFSVRGVDLHTSNSPSSIFFIPQIGNLYVQGDLQQLLLVDSILKQAGVLTKEAK